MADLSDVLLGLQAAIVAVLYPTGSPPSILNIPVKVYPGWPDPQQLDVDLAPTGTGSPPTGAPKAIHVSIFPHPTERNVTRYPQDWSVAVFRPHTFSISAAALAITIAGAGPTTFYPHNFAVFANGRPYVYQTIAGQAPSDIAAGIAALINEGVSGVTVSGAVISLPAGTDLGYVRVGTGATSQREVRRQQRDIMLSIWAPNPAIRDEVAIPIDIVLATTNFLTLSDGSRARLIYRSSPVIDMDQKQGIYRRDLIYSVEYATIQTQFAPEIIVTDINLYDVFNDLIYTNDPALPVFGQGLDFSNPANSFNLPNI